MMKHLNPESVREVSEPFRGIYTHAVEITAPRKFLFVSGQIGIAPDGTTLHSFDEQCRQAMSNVEAVLASADMSMENVLRVTYYLTDPADLPFLTEHRQARWRSSEPPAVTTLVVAALARPDLKVEIEVTASC